MGPQGHRRRYTRRRQSAYVGFGWIARFYDHELYDNELYDIVNSNHKSPIRLAILSSKQNAEASTTRAVAPSVANAAMTPRSELTATTRES